MKTLLSIFLLAYCAPILACDIYGTCYELAKPLRAPEGYEWRVGRYAYFKGGEAYGRHWELHATKFELGPADVCYDEEPPPLAPYGYEWKQGRYWNYDTYSSKCREAKRWELHLREPGSWELEFE